MASLIVPSFVGLVVLYVLLRLLIYATQDAQEPPILNVGIPFLGPVLRMLQDKEKFYPRLRDNYGLPFYTLRFPFVRIYVINATELIPAVSKQWRDISFAAIAGGTTRANGVTKEAMDLILADSKTEQGLTMSTTLLMAKATAPGEELNAMGRTAADVLATRLERLSAQDNKVVGFYEWARKTLHAATSEAVYGPENPYRDVRVTDAFWDFEPGFIQIMISPFPKLFARGYFHAREILATAMIDYMRRGGWKTASSLTRGRVEHLLRFGMSLEDIGRCEMSGTIAVLSSTTPCTWWTLFHIFSDAQVLEDVRREVEALVVTAADGTASVDLARVRVECPVLLSTFQETMRHRGVGVSARVLLEDAEVAGYSLKKGGLLMMPTKVQHSSIAAWGPDAGKFDHLRFVSGAPGRTKHNRTAFRVWGGGHVLCPGRHLATAEILAFAALLVLRFDIKPVAGDWAEPTWDKSPMAAAFPIPDKDIPVEMVPRDAGRKWKVTFSDSGSGVDADFEVDVGEKQQPGA